MPETRFTTENIIRLYDEKVSDEYLEIGLDADVGELVEIRSCRYNELMHNFAIEQRVVIHPEQIDLVIQALEKFKNR